MAKTTTKSRSTGARRPAGKSTGRGRSGGRSSGPAPDTTGKHLVIVESPAKARTINKYLGSDYVVMASVGHVRDLPSKPPKGAKRADHPVPGVDVEHDFAPTYEVMPDKKKTVTDLRKAAKNAADVWFATDLDREGEAIAWHLAQALGVDVSKAKRVVFNAITKREIENAFSQPRNIDEDKVNAQQARRILDRIVGYQVSPLLWKKVAGGLSAGRVQSVALRLVVEREREIEAFVPDEYWRISAGFALDAAAAAKLGPAWTKFMSERPPGKAQNAWLSDAGAIRAELVKFDGKKFEPAIRVDEIIGPLSELSDDAIKARLERADAAFAQPQTHDLTPQVAHVAQSCGLRDPSIDVHEDDEGRGPARWRRTIDGDVDPSLLWEVRSVETKRVRVRPPAPFITSTLQQSAATQLGFRGQLTMRIAQQLYEGLDIHGREGLTGLITYMRTDSTHLSGEALSMARTYIADEWGEKYLPDKPNFYSSSNKDAQEAHEAIRPTDVNITPKRVRSELTDDQYKLYKLIWERFVACQCTPAEWDATTVLIESPAVNATFKATGRVLVFDGFYRATGVPSGGDEARLPPLKEKQPLAPFQIAPTQHFTNPPPRYTDASLVKKLEAEGIGRPSTYASIIQVIQDRKYVQPVMPRDKRLGATDLGRVVSDKLVEGFPKIMDVGYTRIMEADLDKIEEQHKDWVGMLREFYGPFVANLKKAYEDMAHAKAETQPAPHTCAECGAPTVYRFGKNGRFLSCSRYPDCKYAAPIDREGNPIGELFSDVLCPICGGRMTKRTGRFGAFLGCEKYPECKGIVNLDPRKGGVKLPKPPPLVTDIECPKCEDGRMNLRRSKRGPWLSCNRFPKCRGRVAWSAIDEKQHAELEEALDKHEAANPVPRVVTASGREVEEGYQPVIEGEGDADSGSGAEAMVESDAA
jgi:DNA topoisomerase-1